ncbi:MAG: methylated-DNA--[protein]-cysteine S-methyltransferase [Lautropia sp.]|nr:methylated-DNA--[protein]-cysteine S-methyltransferase [Lautropia sp.]
MTTQTRTPTYFTHIDSPVGRLMIAVGEDGVRAIEFPENRHPVERLGSWIELRFAHPGPLPEQMIPTTPGTAEPSRRIVRLLLDTRRQLTEYFERRRKVFDLPLAPQGTAFQQRVWQALCEIPYGSTWSYAKLSEHIGNPKAARAVGAANGRNPIPIIIPCHRVVGADGSLTGFGGGLPTKTALLQLESLQLALCAGYVTGPHCREAISKRPSLDG